MHNSKKIWWSWRSIDELDYLAFIRDSEPLCDCLQHDSCKRWRQCLRHGLYYTYEGKREKFDACRRIRIKIEVVKERGKK